MNWKKWLGCKSTKESKLESLVPIFEERKEERTWEYWYDIVEGKEPELFVKTFIRYLKDDWRTWEYSARYGEYTLEKITELDFQTPYEPKGKCVDWKQFDIDENCRKRTEVFEALENPSIEALCKAMKLLLEK